MTAKEYLKQYADAESRRKRLEDEYNKEQELIDAVRSTANYDEMPKSKTHRKNAEDRILKLADKALALNQARLDAIEIRQEVFNTVNKVDGPEGEVLYHRWIMLRRWEEICVVMGYSWRGIHSLHNRALAEIDKILNCA